MFKMEVRETAEDAPVKRAFSMSIRYKMRIAWLAGMLVVAFIVLLLTGLFQRKAAISEAFVRADLQRTGKTALVEAQYNSWAGELQHFASDAERAAALTSLTQAYLALESDNYATSGASAITEIKPLVEGYYSASVLPELEAKTGGHLPVSSLMPTDNRQFILQYLYMVSQPNEKARQNLTRAADGSAYTMAHSGLHPEMMRYARENGISDIILVDYATGVVVYSLRKNPDFGTSLYDGPYRNSAMASAFKSALGMPASAVFVSDMETYAPALMRPCFFMAAPVYAGAALKGAAIFCFEVSAVDGILSRQQDSDAGISGVSTFLLGPDLRFRSTDPGMTANRALYLKKLKRHARLGKTWDQAARLQTTALVLGVDPEQFSEAPAGKEGQTRYVTETGQDVLCTYGPVPLGNRQWILVSQIGRDTALRPARRLLWFILGISLLMIALLYPLVHMLTGRLSDRMLRLAKALGSAGDAERTGKIHLHSDEIGMAMNRAGEMEVRMKTGAAVVLRMAAGEIDNGFEAAGDDTLGKALLKLKDSLVSQRDAENMRKQADEIRNWSAQGVALFNEILRTDNDSMEKLCLNIVRNLIEYLSANQGGMFLMEEEEGSRFLNLTAAYAYDRQKFISKRIGLGEGLAGMCALEKKTVLLSRIPDNYIEITSGLGGAKPGCILIVPLKKDEEVLGVIEIASFNAFKPHEVEFAEKVAESIASALITVQLHLQTSMYLERFRQQAEEMKAQDEELRQNIEELQATHEQMERMKQEEEAINRQKEKEIELNQQLFIDILDKVPAKIFLKDENGVFVLVNSAVSKVYNKTIDQVIGTSDYDNHPDEDVDSWRKQELEIMSTGETTYLHTETTGGIARHLKTIKMPFRIATTGKTGLLGIQFDITDLREKEVEALKLADIVQKKQQELQDSSMALQKEKSLLDALLDNVPECIYFKDKDSRFIRFSKAMLKLFKLDHEEELLGKSDFDFFSDEHARPAYEDEQRIISTGQPIIDLEEKEVMTDGKVSWVSSTKMPLKNTEGEIIGTFGISKSINRFKELEATVEALKKRLEEREKK
jgi:PAS domain S-box-containing protein